jgi:hypothetical protein
MSPEQVALTQSCSYPVPSIETWFMSKKSTIFTLKEISCRAIAVNVALVRSTKDSRQSA